MSHPARDFAARPHPVIRRWFLKALLQRRKQVRFEHRRLRSVVAAKIAERRRPERVVAAQQFLDPARHKARDVGDFRNRMALRQQPDRLVMPSRARIYTAPVPIRQILDAQMIRHMRHGRLLRFMAFQLNCFAPLKESRRVNHPDSVSHPGNPQEISRSEGKLVVIWQPFLVKLSLHLFLLLRTFARLSAEAFFFFFV